MSITITQAKMIRCPYDPNHTMPYDRFLNHLDKCKFPDKHLYRKCKFNPYHVHLKQKIDAHQLKCPDRAQYQAIDDDDDWGVQQQVQIKEVVHNKSNNKSYSLISNSKDTSASQTQSIKSKKKVQNSVINVEEF